MPGIPEFAAPGTQGGGQTVAVNDRPNIITKSLNQTDDVAAGASETISVYAPQDAVWNIQNMRIRVSPPGGDGSGEHEFIVFPKAGINATRGINSDDVSLNFDFGVWTSAMDADPATEAAQRQIIESLTATDSQPLKISYKNRSSVTQSNTRKIDLVVEEVTY